MYTFIFSIIKSKYSIRYLVKNNWIDSGNIVHDKIMWITKIKFISIVPEAVDLNSGSINLKSEKVNLLKHKLLFS